MRCGAAFVVSITVGACADSQTGYGTKETIGTLAGAALGGWAGSTIGHGSGQLAATAAGVVIGGLIGNQIGRYMDAQDQQLARRSEYVALEHNPDWQPAQWHNPNNGSYGYALPQRTYQRPDGQYCREYQTTVIVNGQPQTGFGTACREPDGSWRISG
jgi:surface antigen